MNLKINYISSILFALLPLLNLVGYKLEEKISFGTLLLIIMLPFAIISMLRRKPIYLNLNRRWIPAFCIYISIVFVANGLIGSNGFSGAGSAIFTIIFLTIYIYYMNDSFYNLAVVRRVIEFVTIFASLCLFIQYMGYYILNTFIPFAKFFPYTGEIIEQYQVQLTEGVTTPFFRPSAFFLEPSSFSAIALLALVSLLYPERESRWSKAFSIIVTIGIVLSTSGIGIIVAVGLWGLYSIYGKSKTELRQILQRVLLCVILLCIMAAILWQFKFFREAVLRMFSSSNNEVSAVDGRTGGWSYFTDSPFINKIFGNGFNDELTGIYFTGLIMSLYRFGIIGTLLFINILIKCFKSKNLYRKNMSIVVFLLFVSSALHNFVDMTFYLALITCEVSQRTSNCFINENKAWDEYTIKEN